MPGAVAGTSADVDGELHYGAGIKWRLTDRLGVRLDARHLCGPARDGSAASLFELGIGIYPLLGG